MRDEILALLEGSRHSTVELAGWLQQPRIAVAHVLRQMVREGHLKQVGTAKDWALAGFVAPQGRPKAPAQVSTPKKDARAEALAKPAHIMRTERTNSASPNGAAKPQPLANQQGSRANQQDKQPVKLRQGRSSPPRGLSRNHDIDRQLGIEEPSSGPSLCLHCFGRFTPIEPGQEFCSKAHAQLGPNWAPISHTEILNGVEVEVQSAGRAVMPWPENMLRASSLNPAPMPRRG